MTGSLLAAPLLFAALAGGPTAGPPDPAAAAAAVDRAVNEYLSEAGVIPAGPANDDDFLRRASFDLAGRPPTPAERAAFDADWDDARYAAAAGRLLASPDYGDHWAFYWKEVIFTRSTDPRSRRAEPAFREWLADELNAGAGWDAVAADLLTATGEVFEDGSTGLFAAHGAVGKEVAGEAARVFLGVQIGCAECHDHPYDAWTREDFHALAAYFPRATLRRTNPPSENPPQFSVVANDRAAAGGSKQITQRLARLKTVLTRRFRGIDKNNDGGLNAAELARTPAGRRASRVLALGDADGDELLSPEEVAGLEVPPAALAKMSGGGEHLMPDLEHPGRPGTRVDPAFFLTGAKTAAGLPDADRRAAAADAITGSPWFARAVVNRVFTELVGDGFYTPVDDLGPDRSVRLEPALDALAEGFVASGHDLRWLLKAIVLTDAYQRTLDADAPPFAAAKPGRLRANQVQNALLHVAGGGDLAAARAAVEGAGGKAGGRGGRKAPRGLGRLIEDAYGADPSLAREDRTGDVPQALLMMNGPVAARLTGGQPFGPVARLLRAYPRQNQDPAAVAALYDVALTRPPTADESAAAVAYVRAAESRPEGYQDVLWALLNGPEFLTKR